MPTPTDDRPKMNVTLADLGILADTAGRNGTRDAFVEVALQWVGGANAEIERLQAENQALRADADAYRALRRRVDSAIARAGQEDHP